MVTNEILCVMGYLRRPTACTRLGYATLSPDTGKLWRVVPAKGSLFRRRADGVLTFSPDNPHHPSETGAWQSGDLDLSEYLDRYRNQRVDVIIASVGIAPAPTYTCGVCGFVYNEQGECPRRKLASEQGLLGLPDDNEGQDILDQVKQFLEESGGDEA